MTQQELTELLTITYKEVYELGAGLHHDFIEDMCDELIKNIHGVLPNLMAFPGSDCNTEVLAQTVEVLISNFKKASKLGAGKVSAVFDDKVKPVVENATKMIVEVLQQSPFSETEEQDYYTMFKEAREKQSRDMFNKIVEKGLNIAGDDPEARKRAIEGAVILSKYMK